MRNFVRETKERVLVYDGSKGTLLQRLGMKGGECPEEWNVSHSDQVRKIYSMYKEAGADVIQTNTFQGSRMRLQEYGLGERTYELNFEGVRMAKEVMGQDGFVAASIGPLGKLFEPSGELTFEAAYAAFKEQVTAVADGGADIINFETFTDLAEMRAALLAAKETVPIPVICSIAFEANGRTLMGTDPYTAAVVLTSLGADMIGTNCSLGPVHLVEIVKRMSEAGGSCICAKPNAGLPEMVNGEAVFNETPEKFAALAGEFVKYGVRLLGGCCGTDPGHIEAVKAGIAGIEAPKIQNSAAQVITSGVKHLRLETAGHLQLGSIDCTRDDGLNSDLAAGDTDTVVDIALDLAGEGYDAIYINVDRASRDGLLLAKVVNAAQGYIREPFILETEDSKALEKALRIYKGKAGIIVDGYAHDTLEALLSVAKKYGSTIIGRNRLGN